MKNIYIQNLKALALLVFCILNYFNSFAQVGVETNDPSTPLDVNGTMSLREGQQLTFNNGNNNDIDLGTMPYSFYIIIGPTTSFNITGVVPLNGADGQIVTLQNNTNATMNIIHDALSVAENRIQLPNGRDYHLHGKYTSVTFQYNATNKRWNLVNGLNNVQTWYLDGTTNLIDGRKTIVTVNAPFVTSTDGVSVSIVNLTGLGDEKFNIIVEYVEVINKNVIVRINNKNPQTSWFCTPWGGLCSSVDIGMAFTFNVN
ncbi:MAG: hypothetical protein WBA61_01315 [Aequorivita sp.]